MIVLVETSRALPLIAVSVTVRVGSVHDPEDRAGLARVTGRMLRRGAGGLEAEEIEQRIDEIGGDLGIHVGLATSSLVADFLSRSKDGIVDLLVCDYRGGELRGYVRHDPERLAALETFPTIAALFGAGGYLALTFDLTATKQRYQGIVPLEGESLAEACQEYFARSEQIPTLIRTGIRWDGHNCIAGGLLVQHLPQGEEGRARLHVRMDHPEWQHVAALAGSTRYDELIDADLSLEALVWRLFHEEEEVRIEPLSPLRRGCRCTVEHYADVLSRFSADDRDEMRGDDGLISVDCAFCSKIFKIA